MGHFLDQNTRCLLDFLEIVLDGRHWKVGKSDCFGFSRKIYIMLIMRKMGQVLEPGVNSYFVRAELSQTSDDRKTLGFTFLRFELRNDWLISSVSPEILLKCSCWACLQACGNFNVWDEINEKFILWRFGGQMFGQ